jgi:hypothetical protein
MEKYEFMSPGWIKMARGRIQEALSERDLAGVDYTLCEEFTNPPEHLRREPAGTIGFYVRVDDGRVEVGDRPTGDADLRIVSEYEDALLVARDPEAPAADAKVMAERMAAGRLSITGDPQQAPAALRDLDIHKLLASATA